MSPHPLHKGIKTTPLQKWEEGILGTSERPGIGMPARIADEDRLRLDFMPFIERTVQEYGVVVDNICYYSDVLRKWIHALEPGDSSRKRKFIFRLDYRDISVIQFFDPDTQSYAPIPYRDATHPPISVWELRAAEKRIKERGLSAVNETLIFEALEEMREIEQHAETQTKRARRENQRRRNNAKAAKKNGTAQAATEIIQKESPALPEESEIEDILPYDDIEEASL
jgi:putative transposase